MEDYRLRNGAQGKGHFMRKSADPTDIHVGKRVRMRRLMLKMSQGDLASSAGITFQQIQKYEKGTNRISSSRLQQFADVLDVPISYFFEDAPYPSIKSKAGDPRIREGQALQAFMATKDGLALANAFNRIRGRGLRLSVVHLVEHLSGE
jgi:transcriptional regulator with XRE-family HTH domain